MEYLKTEPWQPAVLPWQLQPPQWSATLIIKGTFDLIPDAAAVWAAEQQPLGGPQHIDEDPERALWYGEDFVPWKAGVDVVVVGSCHPPGDTATVVEAGVGVGDWRKRLLVIGDRFWKERLLGATASEPQPFERLPMSYERAFGGPGHAPNPIGRGLEPSLDAQGNQLRWLPNIETPGRLVASPRDKPPPAGFGPIPRAWPQRMRKLGSYRGNYLRERWPWPAADLDLAFFNSAPEDQQLPHLRGDEELLFEHLHPSLPLVRCRLPGLRPRCLLQDSKGVLHEPELRLDAVWLHPENLQAQLVWRGRWDVADEKLSGWSDCFITSEPLAATRSREDLLSERAKLAPPVPEALPAAAAGPVSASLPSAAVAVAAVGSAPAPAAEPAASSAASGFTAGDAESEAIIAAAMAEAEAAYQELLGQVAASQAGGMPVPKMPATLLQPTPPPTPFAAAAIDAELLAAVQDLQAQLLAAGMPIPAGLAAMLAAPPTLPAGLVAPAEESPAEPDIPAPPTPAAVVADLAAGVSLQGRDLSGIDLSQQDLRGADLRGAILAGANLRQAVLRDADLSGADLTGACLVEIDAAGLRAVGADLTKADLQRAKLVGADLQQLILVEAQAAGADFTKADLRACRAQACDLSQAQLTEADCREAALPEACLDGACCRGGNFQQANLQAAHGTDLDASGALLQKLKAAGARLPGIRLREAEAEGAIFEKADLRRADLHRARLRGAECSSADLREATLSQCDAAGARFVEANLSQAQMQRCNLFRADLQAAILTDADLREANCYEAEFWQATTSGARFEGANILLTKLALIRDGKITP